MATPIVVRVDDDDDDDDFDFRRKPKRPRPSLTVTEVKAPRPSQKENCSLHKSSASPSVSINAPFDVSETQSSTAATLPRRFECVVCCADLDGIGLTGRIEHILRCKESAAKSERLPTMDADEAICHMAHPPASQPAGLIPAIETNESGAAQPPPQLSVLNASDAECNVAPAVAADVVEEACNMEPPPPPTTAVKPSALPPQLEALMASARRVWGKQPEQPQAVPPLLPPPPPKDAFAALMQGAAAAPTGAMAQLAPTKGGRANGYGRGGRGGGRGGRGGGRGWGGGGENANGRPRSLQPFKRVEGTRYVVDGFTCGASAGDLHFLTHFHADHYIGITKRWPATIYASAVTAALVTLRLGVPATQLHVLPMDTPTVVDGGARVTLIDANHCPGAVLLLFQLSDGRTVLHTGDFRYDSLSMRRHPAIAALPPNGLHALYLDTTYLDPKYRFPTQQAVVRHVVDTCRLLAPCARTLVLFGAYSIGKERVFLQVARDLGVSIHVERQKMRLIECMHLPPEDRARLTSDPAASTRWRVVPMAHLRANKLRELLAASRGHFEAVVAFRPTGWAYGKSGGGGTAAAGRTVRLGGNVTIVEVPYSEHSSFEELRQCVHDLAPRKIVATVGAGPKGDRHAGLALLRD